MRGTEAYLLEEEGGSSETSAEGPGLAARQAGEEQLHPNEESCCHASNTLQSLDCKTAGNGLYLKFIDSRNPASQTAFCSYSFILKKTGDPSTKSGKKLTISMICREQAKRGKQNFIILLNVNVYQVLEEAKAERRLRFTSALFHHLSAIKIQRTLRAHWALESAKRQIHSVITIQVKSLQ